MGKMKNTIRYILIVAGVIMLITLIILALRKRKRIVTYDIQDYSDGLTDEEAKNLAEMLWSKIDGWSYTSMTNELTALLSTNNRDFVKVYNAYAEITGNSLRDDLSHEWFNIFGDDYELAKAVIQRMENLNLQ